MFGDWREEVIWRTENNTQLIIFSTTTVTTHKLRTLMHDSQYRQEIARQNVGYNQPPHTRFFFGDGIQTPAMPDLYFVGKNPNASTTSSSSSTASSSSSQSSQSSAVQSSAARSRSSSTVSSAQSSSASTTTPTGNISGGGAISWFTLVLLLTTCIARSNKARTKQPRTPTA